MYKIVHDDLSKIRDYKLLIFFFRDRNIKITAILVSLEFTVHIPYLTVEVYTNFQILKSSKQCLHLHKSNSFRSNGVSARMPIKGCAMDLLHKVSKLMMKMMMRMKAEEEEDFQDDEEDQLEI